MPPPPKSFAAKIYLRTTPYLEHTDGIEDWQILANSIREEIRLNPELIDNVAKRVLMKVKYWPR